MTHTAGGGSGDGPKPLGLIWVDCSPSVTTAGLVGILEGQARVHNAPEPPQDAWSSVILCPNGREVLSASVERHHWVRQKRLQGSHGTNDDQARGWLRLIEADDIDPVVGQVLRFEDIPGPIRTWPRAGSLMATPRSSSAPRHRVKGDS